MNLKQKFPIIDALQASKWDRAIFQQLADSGLDAVHVTLAFWHDCKETLSIISKWNQWFIDHNDLILLVRTIDDVRIAHDTSRVGIIFGFQNSSPIEDELGLIEIFHTLGVRVMQLTYNNQSLLGTGCYESNDAGLTKFGRNAIDEMNRLGMVIDVSHTSEITCFEAIEYSKCPIAVTHANPISYRNVVRNKSDELLIALAESGGMLGFSLYPLHLEDGSDCTLESFCQMVCRAADLIGVEHLGIGSDLCLGWPDDYLEYMRSGTWSSTSSKNESSSALTWPDYPSWFCKLNDFSNIGEGLLETGFNSEEVNMIMGANWLRFFEEVW